MTPEEYFGKIGIDPNCCCRDKNTINAGCKVHGVTTVFTIIPSLNLFMHPGKGKRSYAAPRLDQLDNDAS